MKYKPLRLNDAAIRRILNANATALVFPLRPQPDVDHEFFGVNCMDAAEFIKGTHCIEIDLPIVAGDRFYVREAWNELPVTPGGHMRITERFYYRADPDTRPIGWRASWNQSTTMPRRAARIFLQVDETAVRLLQSLSKEYYLRSGFKGWADMISSWNNGLLGKERALCDWDANRWVQEVRFHRIDKPEGWCK